MSGWLGLKIKFCPALPLGPPVLLELLVRPARVPWWVSVRPITPITTLQPPSEPDPKSACASGLGSRLTGLGTVSAAGPGSGGYPPAGAVLTACQGALATIWTTEGY